MKDGYRYKDGVLEIADYGDNSIREVEYRDYQDNIDELLIVENMIEELYKMKEVNDNNINRNIDYISKYKSLIPIIYGFTLCFSFLFGGFFSGYLNFSLGISKIIMIGSTFIVTALFAHKFFISNVKDEIKIYERLINGEELVLEMIKDKLRENKELLKILKEDVTRFKEEEIKNNFSYKQLDYVDKLNDLKKELDLYYYIGADENKMVEFYNNDTFSEHGFNEDEVKILKRILDKRVSQNK